MLRPMLVLTFGVAILDRHTRLAHLEADAPLVATFGTACVDLVHPPNAAESEEVAWIERITWREDQHTRPSP